MLRALVWKEWREQRSLMVAGTALAATLPLLMFVVATMTLPRVSGQGLADVTMLAFVLMLWPMFVAAAAAGTFANEATGRTTGFLLSRPVSRSRIWLAKVGLAAGAALIVVAASLVVGQLLQWVVGAPGAAEASLVVLRGYLGRTEDLVAGVPSLFLCFCAATFLSARVARPFAAAIGGLATTVAMLAMIAFLAPRVGLLSSVQSSWVAAETTLAAAVLLALSRRQFVRGESLTTSSLRRTAAILALVAVGVIAAGFLPALYADTFADLDRAVTREFALSPDGSAAVVTASQYPALFGSLWRLPDEVTSVGQSDAAAEPLRLTRRMAFSPFFGHDDEWVYYFTERSFMGAVGGSVDLWAARIDGSGERLVVEAVGRVAETNSRGWPRAVSTPAVSRDGARVAFANGWWGYEPLLIDLERGKAAVVTDLMTDVDPLLVDEYGDPIAWTQTGELLFSVRRAADDTTEQAHAIVAYDVDAGRATALRSREVRRGGSWALPRFLLPTSAPHGYLPGVQLPLLIHVEERSRGGDGFNGYWELAVADLSDGSVERVESFPCGYPGAAVSADAAVVAYRRHTRCEEDDDDDLVGVDPILVVRDLAGGTTREIREWGGRWNIDRPGLLIEDIAVSPSGRRTALYLRRRNDGPGEYLFVEADGTTRSIDMHRFIDNLRRSPRTTPRWLDEDHIFLRYSAPWRSNYLGIAAAVVMDVNDGAVKHEYLIPPTGTWIR